MSAFGNPTGEVLPAPKQIRFVNNQGQPPTKRRRINAACLTCRKRKTRCAGEHPTCSTCTKNGHVCLGYSDQVEKRTRDSHGQPSSADQSQIDPDDDDSLDEEPDIDRKQPRDPKNVNQKSESTADDVCMSGARVSDAVQDHVTPNIQFKSETIEWDEHQSQQSQPTPRPETLVRRPPNPRHSSFSTEDGRSPSSRSPVLHHNESSHRVPFFRYFGPTAIVPGFKQMVVKVRDRRRSSMSATSPSTGSIHASGLLNTAMQSDPELGHLEEIPVYDPNDPSPVHPLILNLVENFFLRLGSNYPFMRHKRFIKRLEEKRVESILVDAVCALAARFSDIPLFRKLDEGKLSKSEFGNVYAQRAKAAIVETFAWPSVGAVQASLLLAYECFGADQDSALWMYLGIAIRMAVDLGLPKEDGIRYRGAKDPWYTRWHEGTTTDDSIGEPQSGSDEDTLSPEEQKELEQERIDTFWAVFFLDRAISSGTGRPVTLKDDDYDLELPKIPKPHSPGWPNPNSFLLRIIHLYGRVADVLNNLKQPNDLTRDKIGRLVQMENELTKLYQRMDGRLRFDAVNFQTHVKNGRGTTFILLHFWFHALIIVLHQPTLLTGQGAIDRKHQLKPHSRELSMSSAKTIADILAFAELLDPRCFIGNPFTSQPIYIAACAFLMESKTSASQPTSRAASPRGEVKIPTGKAGQTAGDVNPASRHLLLASAASQNYQLCYKALKQMHAYWGGVRYILNVLDQKSQGLWDCETYTTEEYESTKRMRRESAIQRFATAAEHPASPSQATHSTHTMHEGPPLAWSLTGTTNSPNSSQFTLLFQNSVNSGGMMHNQHAQHQHQEQHQQQVLQSPQQGAQALPASGATPPGNMIYDPIRQSLPETTSMYPPPYPQPNTSALRGHPRRVLSSPTQGKSHMRFESFAQDDPNKVPSTPDGKVNMAMPAQGPIAGVAVAYAPSSQPSSGYDPSNFPSVASPSSTQSHTQTFSTNTHSTPGGTVYSEGGPSNFAQSGSGIASSGYAYMGVPGSNLHLLPLDHEADIGQHLNSFESAEMMSWFGDYFPNDIMGLFPGDSNMG
ncbi:fungal-specific transcription factor domain-containing protein [Xylariaceae sp. FL0016]|nr:fungal-specific transcription factor domain-containing protein [Xylariaceae sp. FL0016]